MKYIFSIFFLVGIAFNARAQNDPEFPKEFIMHLRLHQGMITNFHANSPEVYVIGLQAIPQYTVVKNLLRAGIIADLYYTGK
ncbi:MAG: hypothetical protein EOO20_27555, partial [Chryseobacterium sp.]